MNIDKILLVTKIRRGEVFIYLFFVSSLLRYKKEKVLVFDGFQDSPFVSMRARERVSLLGLWLWFARRWKAEK